MSTPLRLVPQAAQPIKFSCPLCKSVHAAYIFGTSQFRIHRCAGCALTFSEKHFRPFSASTVPSFIPRTDRSERHHASLLAALTGTTINGPVLVVADPADGLVPL